MAEFVKSTIVNAPIDACYLQWSRIHEFPRFMDHIESVTPTQEPSVWHWITKSDNGNTLEWDAKWDINETDRRITWHTVDNNALLSMKGSIGFAKLSDMETQVTTVFEYHCPGGALTESIAGFIANPDEMVENDIQNFKHLMESIYLPHRSAVS